MNWSSEQPSLQERRADDPRNYVGDVVEAGLISTSSTAKSAYRNNRGRRVSGLLSIGDEIVNFTKTGAENELTDLELIEVSIVARDANDRGSGRA